MAHQASHCGLTTQSRVTHILASIRHRSPRSRARIIHRCSLLCRALCLCGAQSVCIQHVLTQLQTSSVADLERRCRLLRADSCRSSACGSVFVFSWHAQLTSAVDTIASVCSFVLNAV